MLRHVDRLLTANPVALAKVNGKDKYGLDDALQASAAIIAFLQAINDMKASEIVDLASNVIERDPLIWRDAAIAATAQALGSTSVDAAKKVDLRRGASKDSGCEGCRQMKGHIQQRGPNSWRLKFDVGRDPGTGRRLVRYSTFRGTKREAQVEIARLITEATGGNLVEPTKLTVGEYIRSWISVAAAIAVSPKTAERYRQLIEGQIVPHLGAMPLQRLRPTHIAAWHATLLTQGRHDGGALSARTVGHAHRVLHKAMEDAVDREIITKNPTGRITPPKVEAGELTILTAEQVSAVLSALADSPIFPHVVVLLSTGMRRGELMGLQWGDVDLEAGRLWVNRSLEVTKAGLRLKPPKTRSGKRQITLPATAVQVLADLRRIQLETRLTARDREASAAAPRLRAARRLARQSRGAHKPLAALGRDQETAGGDPACATALACVGVYCVRPGRGDRLSQARPRKSNDHAVSICSPVQQDGRDGSDSDRGPIETDREQILTRLGAIWVPIAPKWDCGRHCSLTGVAGNGR